MQSAVRFRIAGKCLPSSHSIARSVCKWCCGQCVIRTRCIFCLVHQNRQAIIEYYIQVRKIYFYAAVGLLEGTNPMLPLSFRASTAGRSAKQHRRAFPCARDVGRLSAVIACSVTDAPFVFLNAIYINKRSTDSANKAFDGTSINALVLMSFATSAALLGFVFTPLTQRGCEAVLGFCSVQV